MTIRCPECKHSFETPKSRASVKLGEWIGVLLMLGIIWVIILGLYWMTRAVLG